MKGIIIGWYEMRHITYRLGDSDASTTGDIAIPAVPDGALFATIDLAITARDGAGQEITSEYLFGVHRALEQFVSGDSQVAEIEAAVPVSGCHSGGDTVGRELAYAEQTSDVRARAVTYNWNEAWLEDNGELDDTEGLTELALRRVVAGKRPGPSTDVWTVGYGPGEEAGGPAVEPGTDDFWQISSADVLAGRDRCHPARRVRRLVPPDHAPRSSWLPRTARRLRHDDGRRHRPSRKGGRRSIARFSSRRLEEAQSGFESVNPAARLYEVERRPVRIRFASAEKMR